MPLPKIIPALADLTQDIAGPVPVSLLHAWATGEQDLDAALTLLSPYRIDGTVISSDTSGLSRMTQATDLLEVLNMVSQPKEILYALGREIGGRAIGVWVADNTEMIYPNEIPAETIVDAMAEVQFRIAQRLPVRIGMCIHSGSFYEIGGGLYGADADRVEYLAETCAGPDEILITEQLLARFQPSASDDLQFKTFRHDTYKEHAWLLRSGRRVPNLAESDRKYPHPFPEDFFPLLPRTDLREEIYARWLREKVVVFLARYREAEEFPTHADMLDTLVSNALMDTVIRDVAREVDTLASSGGGLAILTFPDVRDAIGFTRLAHERLIANGLQVVAGVDYGPVMMFQNRVGPCGISGDPINLASKLAEDVGRLGCISVTDRAARLLGQIGPHEHFEIEMSGVQLHGIILT